MNVRLLLSKVSPSPALVTCALVTCALALSGCALGGARRRRPSPAERDAFAGELERLRAQHRIPGMSVAVVQDQRVILARGLGQRNLEEELPATADTPYNIASCTKPIAATVLMGLVEEGKLDLDAPMAELLADAEFDFQRQGQRVRGYAEMCAAMAELAAMEDFPLAPYFADYRCDRERITVRHHLTHTAQGVPGERYRYHGFLYGWLSLVAEQASGVPFADLLVERVTGPLEMADTYPNPDPGQGARVRAARSVYYRVDPAGGYERSQWPSREFVELFKAITDVSDADADASDAEEGSLDAAAGIITTVRDLAKVDVAMDRNEIVSEASKEAMWTAARSNSGEALPYGLGWFVQEVGGEKLVWHYGNAPYAYSSLMVKVPGQEVTLILLANSDGLSADYDLGAGDVLISPFARAFLRRFTDLELPES